MHAIEDSLLAYMYHDDIKNFIFYTDLRAFGKGFDEYIKRGKNDYGIKYIRARPREIIEDTKAENLLVGMTTLKVVA